MINPLQKRVLMLAVKAGELMMKNGAEVYRVEDTITRICNACHMPNVEVFATPTGVFVSIDPGKDDNDVLTYVSRLHGSTTNLKKISDINTFSRVFTTTDMSIEEGLLELEKIDKAKSYSVPLKLLGAALVSAFFCAIFSNDLITSVCALFTGVITYSLALFLGKYDINFFIRGLCCCFLSTFFALLAEGMDLTNNYGAIVISTMMLFVPGAAITNSIRDFLSGDMLSGLARLAEAAFVAISLATGAGLMIKLWSTIGGLIV